MSFITGLLLIDAPASALNNLGNPSDAREDNIVRVKSIKTREGSYPYVSAQAFRYWLRTTLERGVTDWQPAPIYRELKIAYTDANPIQWWDDDLFGYMRAPSTKTAAVESRKADVSQTDLMPVDGTVTRLSPFRISTLVSVAPATIVDDFGTMSRHEGNPVPHEHQFYRATIRGLFSLDLHACGTFSYRNRTGYRNLDQERIKRAVAQQLEHLEAEKSYRLPQEERIRRVASLFEGLAQLEGGAKQTLHYTDVAPALVIMAVTRGGNNIFGHVVGATGRGLPELKLDALKEALEVFEGEILSDVYVGWVKGYLDDERAKLEAFAASEEGISIKISHPRDAFKAVAEALRKSENRSWLD